MCCFNVHAPGCNLTQGCSVTAWPASSPDFTHQLKINHVSSFLACSLIHCLAKLLELPLSPCLIDHYSTRNISYLLDLFCFLLVSASDTVDKAKPCGKEIKEKLGRAGPRCHIISCIKENIKAVLDLLTNLLEEKAKPMCYAFKCHYFSHT